MVNKEVLLILFLLLNACQETNIHNDMHKIDADQLLFIPVESFPNISLNIQESTNQRYCTIDKSRQNENKVKKENNLSENTSFVYPFLLCKEAENERITFQIPEKEAEQFGKWLHNELRDTPDGTKILIIFEK